MGSGAIVQLMYHNCIPTRDELCEWDDIGGAHPQHLSDAQWADLVKDGGTLNKAWKARLDALSVFFADLKSAGIAPLFRPLHEMNQGVFWWGGRSGAAGTRQLFQITHDYLVQTKGFDNIIWVWDIQDFGSLANDVTDYNPGDSYFDIAALDVYDGGYDSWKYDAMKGIAGGKPFAIGECEHPPTSALLAQQPKWAFFMLWPDFLDENAGNLPALYGAGNVVTEGEMPGGSDGVRRERATNESARRILGIAPGVGTEGPKSLEQEDGPEVLARAVLRRNDQEALALRGLGDGDLHFVAVANLRLVDRYRERLQCVVVL